MEFSRIKEETTHLRILQNNLHMTVFHRMGLFASQSITQSEDRIYLIKKKLKKILILKTLSLCYRCLIAVITFSQFTQRKILDSLQLCSPRKYYPPPPPQNRGQFCFRPPAPWNFHSRGCLSYPPSPGIPTQSKMLLHHTFFRKIIVNAIKQRKNVLFMLTLWRTYKFIHPP